MIRYRALLSAALIIVACGCGNDSRRTVRLRILATNRPQAAVEQRLADEKFTPLTGITVSIDIQNPKAARETLFKAIGSQESLYDIVHYDRPWLEFLHTASALEPLNTPEYLGEANCPIAFDDFIPAVAYSVGKFPLVDKDVYLGRYGPYRKQPVLGLPWSADIQVLFYRRDLFETNGLEPAQTWDAFLKAALILNDPPRIFGAATHASPEGDCIIRAFLPILWSFGGELWDSATECPFRGTRTAVSALSYYSDWFHAHGIVPQNCGEWDDGDVVAALLEGRAAMAILWSAAGNALMDPRLSRHTAQFACSQVPGLQDSRSGAILRAAVYRCQGTGIISSSGNKRAAWSYLKWLLSTPTQQALVDDRSAGFMSVRRELAAYLAAKAPRNRIALDSFSFGRDFRGHPGLDDGLPIIQRELHSAFIGEKPASDALNAAGAEMNSNEESTGDEI